MILKSKVKVVVTDDCHHQVFHWYHDTDQVITLITLF